MSNIVKFRKRITFKQKIIVTVVLAIFLGFVLGRFLPDNINTLFEDNNEVSQVTHSVIEGDISGYAVITDGDTIKINGIRIRFHGIDAPEIAQPCWKSNIQYQCGEVAKAYLSRLINNKPVTCQTLSMDKYGRKISKCYNYKNQDIEAMMVSSGMATAYLYYSQDYATQQDAAKRAKRGIWAGRFTEPYQYRKERK